MYGTFVCEYNVFYVNNKKKRMDSITYSYKDSREMMYTKGKEEKCWETIEKELHDIWGSRSVITITKKQIIETKEL